MSSNNKSAPSPLTIQEVAVVRRHTKSVHISTSAIFATGKQAPKLHSKTPKNSAKRLIRQNVEMAKIGVKTPKKQELAEIVNQLPCL